MGFWDTVKRGALAVGTGGISEGYGFKTADDVTGKNGQKALGGVGGFFGDTFGNPDDIAAAQLTPGDYSNEAVYSPYSTWLDGQQGYQYDPSQSDQTRGLALQAAQGYQGVLDGSAMSLAQMQQSQGLAQAQAQAMQMAASARGGPGAQLLAQQNAQRQGAGLALQGNAQAGMLRAQEENAARQGLGQLGTQLYGADQQRQALMATNFQNNQAMQNQGRLTMAEGNRMTQSQFASDKLSAQMGVQQINASADQAAAARRAGLINQAGQIATKAAAGA